MIFPTNSIRRLLQWIIGHLTFRFSLDSDDLRLTIDEWEVRNQLDYGRD